MSRDAVEFVRAGTVYDDPTSGERTEIIASWSEPSWAPSTSSAHLANVGPSQAEIRGQGEAHLRGPDLTSLPE